MAKVTFETLNPKAKLFSELMDVQKYPWWQKVKDNDVLYIEVRKDNNINVYYQGGSVMRLHYCSRHKKVQAFTHEKYIYGKGDKYIDCANLLNEKLDDIIKNIPVYYSQKKGISKEKWSEKYIQGNIIISHRQDYIDSEFAYIENNTDVRIDLVSCIAGEIRFLELKRIDDNRMVSLDMNPEIIAQITNYRKFISSHNQEILNYYKKLYTIKKDLGLSVPYVKPYKLNPEPLLLIFDRWVKETDGRTVHREMMENILEKKAHPVIKYEIYNSLDVPTRTFYNNEQKRQLSYYKDNLDGVVNTGGIYNGKARVFVLAENDSKYNFFPSIIEPIDSVIDYFSTYHITWWGENECRKKPTGHLVSSQIHCLNHLFALRKDALAVKSIIEKATGLNISCVLPSPLDKDGYITFEFVYKNRSLLGERFETRGTKCTSVDALVYAELVTGKKILIPIEWKYTETYNGKETREESFGRYTKRHKGSNCQKWTSMFRADPYYELMRQTLLVEMIVKNKDCGLEADDYEHIVVCPNGNKELLYNIQSFREALSINGKKRFHVVDPQDFLAPIAEQNLYPELIKYLKKRYW